MTKEKVFVEEVFTPSSEHPNPVLLKFQNGFLETAHKDKAIYFPAKSDEDKTKRAVVVANEHVYSGVVGQNPAKELTDTYICVRNKETNKVRILPIDQVKLINHVYQDKERTKFAAMTKENSFALMMRNFGGRKDARFLANRERNQVSIDVVKDQLDNTIEESEVLNTSDAVVSAEHNLERIRPQFNKDATNLDNVFNVYDVIPLQLMDRLDEEASALIATEVADIPISSEYLQNAIISVRKGPQSNQTLLKLKIIMYMDGLQTLIKSKGKNLKRLEFSKVTEKVENDIRNRFSDQNSNLKLRTSFSNEKALCYYLVLAFLISDNYELDMNVLSRELCMPKTKILKYGHLINATLKARTSTLVLRLPSSVKPMSFDFVGKRKKK